MSGLEHGNKRELDVSLETSSDSSSDSSPDLSDVESVEISLPGLMQHVRGLVNGFDSMFTDSSGNHTSSSSSSGSSDESELSIIDMDEDDEPNGIDPSHLPIIEHKANHEMTACQICLDHFAAGDQLRLLPCLHRFHVPCADSWLYANANCPVCREVIILSAN